MRVHRFVAGLVGRRAPLITCAVLAACTGAREPVYIAPDLDQAVIGTIALAPIVDARTDPFHDVEVLAYVRRGVERALAKKAYHAVPLTGHEEGAHTAAQLKTVSDAELVGLAPKDVRHLLVVSVDSAMRGSDELGDTTRIKLSGRLIDTRDRSVVWRDVAEGDADLRGLLTVLRWPSDALESAYAAAGLLLSTLPDHPAVDRAAEGYVSEPSPEDSQPKTLRPGRAR